MNLAKIRTYRKHSRWADGLFWKNPVLVGGLALPLAIIVSHNLKSAVAISILMACSLIPTVLFALLIGRRLPQWIASMLYAVVALALVLVSEPLILPIAPGMSDTLGVYLPILSVNTVLSTLCARCASKRVRPFLMVVDAVVYSAGFALAMALIACVRELFGSNTIWGLSVKFPIRTRGMQIAFAGFILVALFGALFRALHRGMVALLCRRSRPKAETAGQPSGGSL